MESLLIALQFLTRIPINYRLADNEAALGRSVLYYPLVGFVIGVLLSVLVLLLSGTPDIVAAAVVLSVWVFLTGGLHLDGLADCADAWVGGIGSPQRSLQIMKDPAAGPIAVLVLSLLLLVKFSALFVLIQQNNLIPLMLAPLLGRCAILLLMLSTPYVSPKGMAEKLLANLPLSEARVVVVISLAFAGLFMGWANVLLAGGLLLWIRYLALKRLGGVTGDVYGAAVELIEMAGLLAAVLL
ncbi:MAG: adenosylcobinamide-GDP ribazoletransferase [Methylomonas sp.]|jgi:adenosylcobinamide-GDP ribazoletransferase|uniref:adenosylcobinamide-GDP ribazoletransferase n=1 Tax=Methylomonas sp. TaxID=418 RepID=UPI0025DBEA66|nr:adenosylcobinamide-GDP ribazoletransferase [Methylomonas sp.]MCK9605549.1 adenosylcobinamide-GDP ribazoletransferase [Methylomonas sp.]